MLKYSYSCKFTVAASNYNQKSTWNDKCFISTKSCKRKFALIITMTYVFKTTSFVAAVATEVATAAYFKGEYMHVATQG